MMFEFFISGKPQGKGRPRMGRNGVVYTPSATRKYEEHIKQCFKLSYPRAEAIDRDVPIEISLKIYFAVPKSWAKYKRIRAFEKLIKPTVKPDMDNIIKAVCDALNGLAYADDKQIVKMTANKYYGSEEGICVRVKECTII